MKGVAKYLFLIIFILISITGSFADIFENIRWNILSSVSVPMNESSDLYKTGLGFTLNTEIPYLKYFQSGFNAGYTIISTPAENDLTITSIGINSGINIFLSSRLNFAFFADVGYYFAEYNNEKEKNPYVGANLRTAYYLKPNFSITAEGGYYQFLTANNPRFDGAKISLGVSFSPQGNTEKNIKINNINFDQIYPVFYKFYDDNSFGSISIENNGKGKIENIKVSFFIKQYMSQPRVCAEFASIDKNGRENIDIVALFNEDILKITEDTKVTADIIVEYDYINSQFTKTISETLRIHHRNAMTWDDDEKVSAFITAKDPGLLRFSKYTAGLIRENGSNAVNLNFRIGMGMFEAIKLYGMNYVIDPTTPYIAFSENSDIPDYLQFPTQTLSYKGGDCDDLTILYCAALESVGIETAFITIPGHIYAAFLIDMSREKAEKYFKNTDNFIFIDNKTWVPVEITMFNENFMKAWQVGAREWKDNEVLGSAVLYPTHDSWEKYEPVGKPGSEIRVELPVADDIVAIYTETLDTFIQGEIRVTEAKLLSKIRDSGFNAALINKLGVLYARFGQFDKAETQFIKVVQRKEYLPSLINLGNILLIKDSSLEAYEYFSRAEKLSPDNSTVLLGLARSSFDTGKIEVASKTYQKLETVNPELADQFNYLGSSNAGVARASQVKNNEVTEWED
jgi:tetratricopeptide (TPR) repeat protein